MPMRNNITKVETQRAVFDSLKRSHTVFLRGCGFGFEATVVVFGAGLLAGLDVLVAEALDRF